MASAWARRRRAIAEGSACHRSLRWQLAVVGVVTTLTVLVGVQAISWSWGFAVFGLLCAVAAFVLLKALHDRDFSFTYVAEHSSRKLPFPYSVSAFWGGQEGSLLLWLLVLCGYSCAAVLTGRRAGRDGGGRAAADGRSSRGANIGQVASS